MISPELTEHRAVEFTSAQLAEAMNVCFEGYVMALQEDKLPIPEEHFDTLLLAV